MKLLKKVRVRIWIMILKMAGLFLIALMAMPSCKSKVDKEKKSTETLALPHQENARELKEIENPRYSFQFLIPADWQAIDSSDNGDGYYLQLPDADVDTDIRIYGSHASFLDPGNDENVKEFVFTDGTKGLLLDSGNDLIIEKYREDNYVIFSVKSTSENWLQSNRDLLLKIGRSIRWI